MKKDPLVSIIGDVIRAKLIRLFVLDTKTIYSSKELANILRTTFPKIRSTTSSLIKDEILIKATGKEKIEKNVEVRGKTKTKMVTKDFNGYKFNRYCPFKDILTEMILHTAPTEKDILIRKLSKIPQIKVLLTSGVFAKNPDSPTDILMVGDKIEEGPIKQYIKEAEYFLGRELRYSILNTNDFVHRVNINDAFIRSILDNKTFVYKDKLDCI